jgi:hypothetical protein
MRDPLEDITVLEKAQADGFLGCLWRTAADPTQRAQPRGGTYG